MAKPILEQWTREQEHRPFNAAAWNRLPNWLNGDLSAPMTTIDENGDELWAIGNAGRVIRSRGAFQAYNATALIAEATSDNDWRMANTRWISGRNAADSASVNLLRLNGSDGIELGAAGTGISVLGAPTFSQLATFSAGASIVSGNLTFAGLAQRIVADFSNATVANRLLFQTSAANQSTALGVIPTGTSNIAAVSLYNTPNPAAAASLDLFTLGTEVRIASRHVGAAYLPMTFWNNNAEQMRIAANGDITIAPAAGKIGLYAATPVAQQAIAAAATDLPTVITLANDLRSKLRTLGVFS